MVKMEKVPSKERVWLPPGRYPVMILGLVALTLGALISTFSSLYPMTSSFQIRSKGPLQVDIQILRQQRLVADYRHRIALACLRIMEEDTEENAAKNILTDISPFVEIVEEALDTVGVRATHSEIIERTSFAKALTFMAHTIGYPKFHAFTAIGTEGQPRIGHKFANINDRPGDRGPRTGSWFWAYHWLGAVTSDKFIREGSLLLDNLTGERIYSIEEYYREMQRLQRVPRSDIHSFHTQHGFLWHYVAQIHKDEPLTRYPVEMAQRVCGNLIWQDEYIEHAGNDIGRECRHGFGHAVFYSLMTQELQLFNVSLQVRQAINVTVPDELLCKAKEICDESYTQLNHLVYEECMGGFLHSVKESTDGLGYGQGGMRDYSEKLMREQCPCVHDCLNEIVPVLTRGRWWRWWGS